jgi:hypothetical protein
MPRQTCQAWRHPLKVPPSAGSPTGDHKECNLSRYTNVSVLHIPINLGAGMKAIFGRGDLWLSRRSWAVLLAVLVASTSHARAPPSSGSGVVSIADGTPFAVIRGDDERMGGRGVTLLPGDMVETGPDAFVVIQMQGGAVIAIGPSTGVYLAARGGALELLVREGWIKADLRADAKADSSASGVILAGLRLGVRCHETVAVLHSSASADEIFDEQGSFEQLEHDKAGMHVIRDVRAGQLLAKDNRTEAFVQARPSSEFIDEMPKAFRDALPRQGGMFPKKPVEPRWGRKVSYADIQLWLAAPAPWRTGFIARFRGRLKDHAFFTAMDAHLAQHPEWGPILHPPRDEGRPIAGVRSPRR